MYEQRDVVLIPFPYSDLTGSKQRPALIISNEPVNEREDRICCLITSQPAQEGIPINSFESGKLPFKSWVNPHRIFTIHEKIIKRKICKVTNKFHDAVLTKINKFLEPD